MSDLIAMGVTITQQGPTWSWNSGHPALSPCWWGGSVAEQGADGVAEALSGGGDGCRASIEADLRQVAAVASMSGANTPTHRIR